MNDRIYIHFAENGNIRKWQREPFEGGVAYLTVATAAVPADIAALVEELRDLAGINAGPLGVEARAEHRAASALTAAYASLAAARSVHRWNVDDLGNGTLQVCRNEHEKGDPCEWETFVPINRAEAAEASLAEARKALEPFAKVGERAEAGCAHFGRNHAEDVPDSQEYGVLGTTWGDLRAARRAHKGGAEHG